MSDAAAPLLLIEDTPSLQMVYEQVLRGGGHRVHSEATGDAGLGAFRRLRPPVVLLDLMLPDADGLDVMRALLAEAPDTRVIVITANGSINRAVEAMRAGAHEFLVKPFDEQRFLDAVRNALEAARPVAAEAEGPAGDRPGGAAGQRACEPPARRSGAGSGGGSGGVSGGQPGAQVVGPRGGQVRGRPVPHLGGHLGGQFVGQSPAMQEVYAKIDSVARSMAPVFITGESGTGKELCAQAVHDRSVRAAGPFIALNCGAIPADLLESEVFGHLRGAFTGAIQDKPGAAASADGGTLFLDEICEMDLALQTKLLRFLQTSQVQPVGAARPRKVDVRIVCATNRDPLEEVARGRFRDDLYYRLHVVPIHMPPLRERGADVLAIAARGLADYAAEEGKHFTGLSEEVAELFRRLPWPGNVRQLLNALRNVVVLHDGPEVTLPMLPLELHHHAELGAPGMMLAGAGWARPGGAHSAWAGEGHPGGYGIGHGHGYGVGPGVSPGVSPAGGTPPGYGAGWGHGHGTGHGTGHGNGFGHGFGGAVAGGAGTRVGEGIGAGLRPDGGGAAPPRAAAGMAGAGGARQLEGLIGRSLAEIERLVIEATIAAEGGSVPRAARVLDVSPSTLYRKREAWARAEAGQARGARG